MNVKIELEGTLKYDGKKYPPGTVVDLPEKVAVDVIRNNMGHEYEEPKKPAPAKKK